MTIDRSNMLLSHSSNKVPEFIKVPGFNGYRIDLKKTMVKSLENANIDDNVCILTVFRSYRDQNTGQK